MGFIEEVKSRIKLLLSDLRKNFGLLVIMIIIWIIFLVGILFLKVYVGPLEPDPKFVAFLEGIGFSSTLISLFNGFVQVLIAAVYVLLWLYLWHRLVRMYFWRTAKKYILPSEESTE